MFCYIAGTVLFHQLVVIPKSVKYNMNENWTILPNISALQGYSIEVNGQYPEVRTDLKILKKSRSALLT